MTTSELGRWGEELAAGELEAKGFVILRRNFRCRQGEIDLIARRGREIAFTEVKLRKNDAYGRPAEFVTPSKQQKIKRAANYFLALNPWANELWLRFDVIEIYAPQGPDGPVRIHHLEAAFE